MAVPYTILTVKRGDVPIDIAQMQKLYVDSVKTFYDRHSELKEKTLRGFISATVGTGAGAGKNRASGATQNLPGGAGIRPATASSIRAIATRAGKFGATKLKSTTERSMRSKGFRVGAPEELPLRSGQNRPKGQGESF